MKHLKEFVKSVPDYRRTDKGNYKYKLEDILLLVILGRLGKCITSPDIIRFGKRNLKRFRSLGILLDGVPSEPTLCRIFKHIDDEAMSERMSEFTSTFHDELVGCAGDILCIDGKAMRGRYLKTDATPTSYPPIPLKEVSPLPQTCAKKKQRNNFRTQTVGQGGCVRMHSYGRRHVLPESHHR